MVITQSNARGRRDPPDLDRGVQVINVVVSKLSVFPTSPAHHSAALQQGTRVEVTQSDTRRCCYSRYLNGGGAIPHIVVCHVVEVVGDESDGPVPELAVVVPPPALDRAVCQQGTRVSTTQSDARGVYDARHLNGGGAGGGRPVPPSSPLLFEPQHFTVPSVKRAHEWEYPRAMLVAVVMPDTSTELVVEAVVPSPRLP